MVGMWSLFNELRPLAMSPAVKARLIRCYGMPSTKNEELNSFECIFHDIEGTRYHFTAPKLIASKFISKFQEGGLYAIRNFGVTHNQSKFRVTSNKYKATFYGNTEVRVEANPTFPNIIYAFKSFDDIQATENIADALPIDVIGRIASRPNPTKLTTRDGKEKKILDLILEDTEGKRMSCTLWENYVDIFMKQYEERQMDVNIIVLQFCRLSMFQGVVKVQNGYQVTKILLNEDIRDIHEFKERLIHSGLSTTVISSTSQAISSTVIDELAAGVTVTSIKDLCENSEGGSFWICGTVVNIDEERGWFYISCKKCFRKLEKLEKQFYCKYCSNFSESGEMKYKLIINVADDSSSSPFVLWDRESKQVIGKSAAEVNVEGIEEFAVPKEIQHALLQQKFMFKIKVPFGEGWAFNKAYSVSTLATDPKIIATHSTNCSDSQQSDSFPKLESSNEVMDRVGEETPVATESKLEDEVEWIDDGSIKRSLIDQFSCTKPTKKAKVCIKLEKE